MRFVTQLTGLRSRWLLICLSGLLLVAGGILAVFWLKSGTLTPQVRPALSVTDSQYASQVTQGVVTNQWFSSLYFTEWSEPLFAYPLTFKLTPNSLEINYPQVVGTPKTVFASHRAQLELKPESGKWSHKEVTSADTTSVGVKFCSQKSCLQTRLAHGLPSLVLTADQAIKLTLSGTILNVTPLENGFHLTTDHGHYLVAPFSAQDSFITVENNQLSLAIPSQGKVLIALQPDDQMLSLAEWRYEVTGVQVGYSVSESEAALGLRYQSAQTPLVAALPHHTTTDASSLGSYHSLRGKMQLFPTHELLQTESLPTVLTVPAMVASLTPAEQAVLKQKVMADAKTLTEQQAAEGVYFGGKDIFKRAQLYEIAKALGEPESSASLENQLQTLLIQRLSLRGNGLENTYLFAQESPKGIMSSKPEFGHEFFNDHHFHFSYYVAAAGILLEHRPDLEPLLQPGLDAIVQDIATTDTSTGFPWLRGFDPYEGHSWADGRALAADGNNQESTSEAINRWYSLVRLGQATQNESLEKLGRLGLRLESTSAQTYWLGQKPERYSFPTGYEYPIASIVWGGKVDYATWFSAEPTHIFGIQFLPSTPAMTHTVSPTTWSKYLPFYQVGEPEKSWNDIWSMVAVTNQTSVPSELPLYEGGNTASWYYLWVTYWTNSQ